MEARLQRTVLRPRALCLSLLTVCSSACSLVIGESFNDYTKKPEVSAGAGGTAGAGGKQSSAQEPIELGLDDCPDSLPIKFGFDTKAQSVDFRQPWYETREPSLVEFDASEGSPQLGAMRMVTTFEEPDQPARIGTTFATPMAFRCVRARLKIAPSETNPDLAAQGAAAQWFLWGIDTKGCYGQSVTDDDPRTGTWHRELSQVGVWYELRAKSLVPGDVGEPSCVGGFDQKQVSELGVGIATGVDSWINSRVFVDSVTWD